MKPTLYCHLAAPALTGRTCSRHARSEAALPAVDQGQTGEFGVVYGRMIDDLQGRIPS
jgi:hypothetical protein